jgi:O-antigen ligase
VLIMTATVSLALAVVPIPQQYFDRLQPIQTYEKVGEESALSRWHFWAVGVRMVEANPLGIGLRQYEQAYDKYDFSHGKYGSHRAVHNSHVQVLAELGYCGEVVWLGLFGVAFFTCFRVRGRSRDETLDPKIQRFLWNTANALIISMLVFIVGGSFLSLALNDITWLTFGMVGALGRLAARRSRGEPVIANAPVRPVPLAFRVVDAYRIAEARA